MRFSKESQSHFLLSSAGKKPESHTHKGNQNLCGGGGRGGGFRAGTRNNDCEGHRPHVIVVTGQCSFRDGKPYRITESIHGCYLGNPVLSFQNVLSENSLLLGELQLRLCASQTAARTQSYSSVFLLLFETRSYQATLLMNPLHSPRPGRP